MELWEAPIWESARRHGIADEEIRHVLRNFIAQSDDTGDDDVTMFICPDATGNLVEVGVSQPKMARSSSTRWPAGSTDSSRGDDHGPHDCRQGTGSR